ncbi:kinase-like domain [Cordyceps militaris]|uniref:Kinase-like domain n=1 Tax=Cordyceps militaris TaxID=73501 RepID=A0A2H4SGI5_CORMI|nr:kinase-like domain [Cordyceps militaris]
MNDRADYDDLAWDRNDEERGQLETPFLCLSTLKTLEAVVGAAFAGEARWVRPVNIGGWNIVFVLELVASKSRVVIRVPRPHVALFAREKTSLETATMKFLSQHTKVSMPKLLSSGQHADVGYYMILEFVENTGLLSRALAKPNEDDEEAPTLNMAMLDYELEAHLYDVAVHVRHFFQPSFSAVGSLNHTPDGLFVVGGRPLTQNMYNMVYLANIPPSVLPAEDKIYHTADDWYTALAEMHMLQLTFQHNDLVKDEDDCRDKYIARHLFLKLARAGKLSTFGFTDDTWSAQSKGNLRGRCKAPSNTGPFSIWCDDFRPANILLHEGRGNGSTVIDWEFTYVAPTQFALDPPWWLLLDVPEMWHSGMEDWAQQYGRCLNVWLQAMKRAEQNSDETPSGYLLSMYMQESWTTGRFWLNYAARKSWAFDSIFWRYLDECFFGKRPHEPDGQKPLWRRRIGLLNRTERINMEAFVERKMKESQVKGLRTWSEQEALERKAEVLFNHDQGPLRQFCATVVRLMGHVQVMVGNLRGNGP